MTYKNRHSAVMSVIKNIIKDSGVSRNRFTLEAGLEGTTLQKLMNKDKKTFPSFVTITKICERAGITLETFGGMYDEEYKKL